MPNYRVTLETMETEPYFDIEADTEEEAIAEAETCAYQNCEWHGSKIENLDDEDGEERSLM